MYIQGGTMKRVLLVSLLLIAVLGLFAYPRNRVIVEIGTGTGCQYCPGAAMGADDLETNNQPAACIEYHGYNSNDPYNTTEAASRISYYAITGFPTAFFDGLNASVGGSNTASMYSTYLPRVTARMAVASHFNIMAFGSSTGTSYSVIASLDKVEPDTNTPIVLHAVLTESSITYNWEGQTHLDFVERLMIPGATGTALNFGTGTHLTVPINFTLQPTWVAAPCNWCSLSKTPAPRKSCKA
jgi:uncharacterized membrane protein YfcA